MAVPENVAAKRYYGWTMVYVAALAMVATLPGRTQGLGLITESLLKDLGIDRVAYANINLWATLIGAAFAIPCGRLMDRYGPRGVLACITAALGLTVIVMSTATGDAELFATVTLSRGLGQTALSVVSLALVGRWFARRLNYAMGIYSLLVGLGFIAAFPSVGQLVLTLGWRTAWSGVGWVLLALIAPLGWLLVRTPGAADPDGVAEAALCLPTDHTLGAALRSPAFWTFALASSLFGLVYSGIALFNESILARRGFPPTTYHLVLAVSAGVGLPCNFAGGWLGTRWPIQRVMAVGMVALAAALALLPHVATQTQVILYAVTMGAAGGVVTVVFFSVWGQVFGRTHLGRIQGAAQMMTVLGSALGPLLLAQTLARTNSYDGIFNGLAVAALVLGVLSVLVRTPGQVYTSER